MRRSSLGGSSSSLWAPVREEIPEALEGERIDRVISMITGASRSVVASWIVDRTVAIDGRVVDKPSLKVRAGQVLSAPDDDDVTPDVVAPDSTVTPAVIDVDDDVIVVDKAAGEVVHPGAGHAMGTIVQGLLARYPEIATVGEPDRPGVVHRLDKGTSGVFVVARSERAHAALTSQLRDRSVGRRYVTWVWGRPDNDRGVVDAPIARAIRDPTRMSVRDDGKDARTHYVVQQRWSEIGIARLACRLETGRTHQIRVHLEAIHLPVVGDARYGRGRDPLGLDRPALHAAELEFIHPGDGALRSYSSALPADLVALETRLGPPDDQRL